MKKLNLFIAAVLAILVGTAALFLFLHLGNQGNDEKSGPKFAKSERAKRKSLTRHAKMSVQEALASRKVPSSRIGGKPGFEAFLEDLSSKDKKHVLDVQNALDNDDFAGVASAARKAMKSDNPAVREAAIEALGWFGPEALPELTPLMADADEDVAQTATTQWELALGEIDDSATRATIAEATMRAIKNKETLQSIVCEITNQDDDFTILEALVSLIEDSNAACAEVAREEYETLTGEEWTNIDAANAWLEQNYDPPQEES